MPILDGFSTAKLIRSNPRSETTPIIFLTANYPSEEGALQGYEAGAVDYLFKPLNVQMLRAKVGFFVELFRKNQEIQRQAELLREAERKAQEKKYQNLVEGIRQGIVWSADARTLQFSFVSRHAEKITGYPIHRWLVEPGFWMHCLLPEDRKRFEHALTAVHNEGTRSALEHQLIKANGDRIWLYTEIHMESGPQLQGLSVDITHLKETEAALREAVRVRDEAIKLREDFLSIASHELKTPITPLQLQLQGFLRMIDTGRLNATPMARIKSMLEISDAQVNRLARLIGQLLDVSRIREGRFIVEAQQVDLAETVYEVVEQLSHELEASECKVKLRLADNVLGHWDRLRIEQVMINLISNATKYAAGKPIEIEVRQDGDEAVLSVRDQGMGIAKEDQKRIFERFERAVPIKNYGGLGLGLYITREIVQLHQGSISVESSPGKGATFTVRLPLNRERAA
jgi:signal transduction histidine kinase